MVESTAAPACTRITILRGLDSACTKSATAWCPSRGRLPSSLARATVASTLPELRLQTANERVRICQHKVMIQIDRFSCLHLPTLKPWDAMFKAKFCPMIANPYRPISQDMLIDSNWNTTFREWKAKVNTLYTKEHSAATKLKWRSFCKNGNLRHQKLSVWCTHKIWFSRPELHKQEVLLHWGQNNESFRCPLCEYYPLTNFSPWLRFAWQIMPRKNGENGMILAVLHHATSMISFQSSHNAFMFCLQSIVILN